VRRAAAEALGQIGDPRAVEALTSALDDESAAARQAAAEALGQIGDPDAVEPLIGALNDQNAKVRVAAAAALDGLAWSPDRGATGAAYWVAKGQWKKCVKIAAIEPLIAVLRDDRVMEIRDAPATRTLVKIGARAGGPLIGSLNDQNGNVRQAAAEALGQIGDPRAVEPLIGVLNDANEKVRRATAEALSRICDPHAPSEPVDEMMA
jgi:HEAT repeat protein